MEKRLPFLQKSEYQHPEQGRQSVTTVFTASDGLKYVRKEMDVNEISVDPLETARHKKIIFNVLREYLEEYLPDTSYVIAKNENNEPTVEILQPFIEGKTWREAQEKGEITEKMLQQRLDIKERIDRASNDPRLDDINESYRISEAFSETGNIIIQPDGRLKVIDW